MTPDWNAIKSLGWTYEYVYSYGCFALFNPEKRLIFKDCGCIATMSDLLKIIEDHSYESKTKQKIT